MEHHSHPTDVPEPRTRPAVGVHPEDIDPLGKAHKAQPALPPEEKRTVFILSIALIATVLLIPILAVISSSPVLNVFLGLSPLIITIILDMVATRQHYKIVVFWINLIVAHLLALAVLFFINVLLPTPMNVPNAVSASMMLGLLVTAVAMFAQGKIEPVRERPHVVQFRPERIEEYMHSIEDKVKALNFAIGRVYRASNGGTSKMRERLRIPSEWYNEFNSIGDKKEQLEEARVLVRKIRDRLALYSLKEKEIFSIEELQNLKHITRNAEGNDAVIDVLKANDSDPVSNYYVSAIEFCDRILEELERKQ